MAISDETAALVAAQLTTAWAAHVAPVSDQTAAIESVVATYLRFRELVRERDPGDGHKPVFA